jgi:hypothetical protein
MKNNLQDFDIVLFKPRNFLHKIIAFFSGRYCHVGFAVTGKTLKRMLDKLSISYEEGTIHESNFFLIHGTMKHFGVGYDFLEDIMKIYGGTDIYRVTINDNNYIKLFVYCASTIYALHYDFLQLYLIFKKIIKGVFTKVSNRRRFSGITCSEWAGRGLILIGIRYNVSLEYITPDQIVAHPFIEYIGYEEIC